MDDVHDDTYIENGSGGIGKVIIAAFCTLAFVVIALTVAGFISGHGDQHGTQTAANENHFDGPDEVVVLTDANFEKSIRSGIVLVDFWMDNCPPCESMVPEVQRLAYEMKGKAVVAKLHSNTNLETKDRLGLYSFPVTLIYNNGRVVDFHQGYANYSQLRSMLDAVLKDAEKE